MCFFQQVETLENEISILSTLKHERIVSFHGSIEQGCHLYLFMDFMAKVRNQIKPYFLEKITLLVPGG